MLESRKVTAERTTSKTLASVDRLALASKVNQLCDIETGDKFDSGVLIDNARAIVEAFDSTLAISSEWYFEGKFRGRSKSFGGLASTGAGQFQTNIEGGRKSTDMHLGHSYEDRVGLYKVTKTDEGPGLALNFAYFLEQVSTEEHIVGVGPLTSILYDKKDHQIKGVVRSEPILIKIMNFKVVWFKQLNLWGKAKLNSLTVRVFSSF